MIFLRKKGEHNFQLKTKNRRALAKSRNCNLSIIWKLGAVFWFVPFRILGVRIDLGYRELVVEYWSNKFRWEGE